MLKIIHFSDVHLGIETYGRLDTTTGMSSRLSDFLGTFDEVVNYAIDGSADLAIFAGDAYKTRDPNPTVQREFARRIKRLSDAGIPTFLLVGNHDVPNASSRANSIDIFATLEVENVTVARTPKTHLIQTKKGPVQIVALPWVTRSTFLTKEDMRGRSFDELNAFMLAKIEDYLDQAAGAIDPAIPAILTVHGTAFGADFGSEKSVMLGNDIVIGRSALANRIYDYVALGHIHKHQVLCDEPVMAYSGSLERIDFGEEKEEKGFMEIELDETRTRPGRLLDFRFVPVQARKFLTLRLKATSEDPTAEVLKLIEDRQKDIEESIIRLYIEADAKTANRLRDDEIRRALKNAYYVAAIKKEVPTTARMRLGGEMLEQLKPYEALEKYLLVKNVPADRAKILMEHAERLMQSIQQ